MDENYIWSNERSLYNSSYRFLVISIFKISEVTPLKISRTGVRVPKLNDAIEWFSFERWTFVIETEVTIPLHH